MNLRSFVSYILQLYDTHRCFLYFFLFAFLCLNAFLCIFFVCLDFVCECFICITFCSKFSQVFSYMFCLCLYPVLLSFLVFLCISMFLCTLVNYFCMGLSSLFLIYRVDISGKSYIFLRKTEIEKPSPPSPSGTTFERTPLQLISLEGTSPPPSLGKAGTF